MDREPRRIELLASEVNALTQVVYARAAVSEAPLIDIWRRTIVEWLELSDSLYRGGVEVEVNGVSYTFQQRGGEIVGFEVTAK